MIRHNWRYKLLALAVALILWNYVNSERNPQSRQTFTVPVRVVGVARSHVAELATSKVSVTIQGPKTMVDAVTKDDIEASVDLHGLRLDKKIVQADVAVDVRLPRAVESDLSISPNPKRIRARVEAVEERRMPVEIYFTSEPPLGYSYGSPLLSPDTVAVSGRASQLAKVSKAVLTLTGDAAGSMTEDYYDVTPIDAGGSTVAEVSVRPAKVKAKLEMVEAPADRTVIVSPVFSGQPKFPLRVTKYTVTPSSVTVVGKPSVLSRISALPTEKIVLEGADSTLTRDVALSVPAGAKVAGVRTVRVTVYIGTD